MRAARTHPHVSPFRSVRPRGQRAMLLRAVVERLRNFFDGCDKCAGVGAPRVPKDSARPSARTLRQRRGISPRSARRIRLGRKMKFLSDGALERLREGADVPDLAGTRYRLLDRIARGGMGLVYTAEDENLQRRVALKVLDLPGRDGDFANRLILQARVLAALEPPALVPVHDLGPPSTPPLFYTMKFVEGQRLDKYIESVSSFPDRLRIFLRICDAVAFAHA